MLSGQHNQSTVQNFTNIPYDIQKCCNERLARFYLMPTNLETIFKNIPTESNKLQKEIPTYISHCAQVYLLCELLCIIIRRHVRVKKFV